MKNIGFILLSAFMLTATVNNGFAQSSEQTKNADSKWTALTVKVKGITCSTDLKMIATSVEKLEGVNKCEIGKKGATSSFSIEYDPKTVSVQLIHEAIEGTGSCENPNERPYTVKQ